MVEEANAASATLAQEAGRLRELIARFTLEEAQAYGYAPSAGSTRRAA
ncbi:hypothetical protein [Sinorhizobium sp. NFACC03]